MKNVMKEAHKMTKEIVIKYPNVDYKTQLGLYMSYLLNKKEDEKVVELKGTEKQIKWAEDIRLKFKTDFYDKLENIEEVFEKCKEAGGEIHPKFKEAVKYYKEGLDYIFKQNDASFFIRNQYTRWYNVIEFSTIEDNSEMVELFDKLYRKSLKMLRDNA